MDNEVKIICLTPVKNEAWILNRFIQCTLLWADYLIITDQNSTDDSREIAKKYNKVILVENPDKDYNEFNRQKLLIAKAREINASKRILITLDADEFLTSNFCSSPEFKLIKQAEPGTVFRFKWAHISPDFEKYNEAEFYFPWAFVDDNTEHTGRSLHSPRIPIPKNTTHVLINDIKVMHYGFVSPNRVKSKYRFYSCFEKVYNNRKSSEINRASDKIKFDKLIPSEWFEFYKRNQIEMKSVSTSILLHEHISGGIKQWEYIEYYWWDFEVVNMMNSKGITYFKDIPIWDYDWSKLVSVFKLGDEKKYRDPRTIIDKIVQRWYYLSRLKQHNIFIKAIDKILILFRYK